MLRSIACSLILALLGLLAPPVFADDTAPPATQPVAPPHAAVIPPGYHVLLAGDRSFICKEDEDAWVKEASAAPPATRPTTLPSDLIDAINKKRSDLTGQIVTDFAITDPKPLNDSIDTDLLPTLNKLDALHPNVYFFPISEEKMTALMESGWADPRYRYIRFARQVVYEDAVDLSTQHPMDDLVMWVKVKDSDDTETHKQTLAKAVTEYETDYVGSISLYSQAQVSGTLATFLLNKQLQDLKLANTEEWFRRSVTEVYAIKYATLITGGSRWGLIQSLLRGDPRNPVDWQPLDLVHPLDSETMHPEYRGIYHNAVIRKGSFVIDALMDKAGDGWIGKVLTALRAAPPANAQDLINAIHDATGVDPTPVMTPFYSYPPPKL